MSMICHTSSVRAFLTTRASATAFGRADARTVAFLFAAGADARAVRADLSAGTAYTLTRIF